ncbi:alpha-ketoglutarate-dependent dioxygenase AlkB family protein [Bowmanella pacifica]|uniref:Alkylated DNA repair protein n=1 Tax=Bowmanella pacifica TaxID=502051 RepID=A0A917YRB2_9ALTE|nr:alpha-ketoglutarate-dependent dioxygenase AlkB [Bowmanella pacifica]GGO64191.1 alkylated DNA repair protein [Bowmanella pacifica]
MQQSLFNPGQIILPQAELDYREDFLSRQKADELLACFRQSLDWRQDFIKLYGKVVKIPRLQAWYGDPGSDYRYSGLTLSPLPWTESLAWLKQACEQACGHKFNAVLANWYRDGTDSMGWHADNEPELGQEPVIASVSLGTSRNLDFRHMASNEKYRIALHHGSLLIMRGTTQQHWQHAIAKSRQVSEERINLTFRYIMR